MKGMGLVVALVVLVSAQAEAGIFSKKKHAEEEVPGGHPRQLVTTNGTVVPAWASRRIEESPVPLYGKSWGRRPWALALSSQATPSAVWARADQLGFGAGPIPGYTNGPGGSGNYPMAHVGPDTGANGWAPRSGLKNFFMPNPYPFNTALTGY